MTLQVFRSAEEWRAAFAEKSDAGAALTIGNFDGVHRGHQQILHHVCESAEQLGALSAVLTFDPHPTRLLRPAQAPPLLMTLEQRLAAIGATGIQTALVARFDAELAQMSAENFVKNYLVDAMRARAVLIGENFRFGHKQAGDVALLNALGRRWNLQVCVEPAFTQDGAVVSSTAIRNAIVAGDVELATRLLGRPYALAGEIRTGTGQGRKFVVPTLNLATQQELLPANGVYATQVQLGEAGRIYSAATNVGLRPTFDGASVTIESHLLDFSETLTAGKMEVRFLKRLRDERKFPGPAALREQILKDVEQARAYLRETAGKNA